MLGVFLVAFVVIPWAHASQQNPCHDNAKKPSPSCTEVKIPAGLCPVCGVAVPMQSDGTYTDCTRSSGLEHPVSGPQCRSLLYNYIELNPCDTARFLAWQLYNSTIPSLHEKGRQRLDYFLYSICENGCDCIPQVGVDPLVKAVDVRRGNCQAHTYYDVCQILPNIRLIRREDDDDSDNDYDYDASSTRTVATLPPVCPLITDWIQNSGDGADFRHVTSTTVQADVEYFLNRLVDAEEMLSSGNAFWDQCISLEMLQGRINTTASVETSSPATTTSSSKRSSRRN